MSFSFTNCEKEIFARILCHGSSFHPWYPLDICVINDNVEGVEWIYEIIEKPYSFRFLELAAHKGSLRMIKLLLQHGCQWNGHELLSAVIAGHLEIAQWLRDNGYPLELARFLMYGYDHPELTEWLKDRD